MELYDFSDDEDGRGLEVLTFCFLGKVGECACDDFLVVAGGVLYGGDFSFGCVVFSEQCVNDIGQVSDAHEEDECVGFWEFNFAILFSVSGDERYGGGVIAVSGWYTGVSWRGESGGDTGDDFEFYAGLFAGEGLFCASSEEVRVTSF